MIRKYCNVDPFSLSDDEWAARLNDALWLAQFEVEQMTAATVKALAIAFGKG